jgi:hypothetical protein
MWTVRGLHMMALVPSPIFVKISLAGQINLAYVKIKMKRVVKKRKGRSYVVINQSPISNFP